jgi:hypothetical protein
VTSGPRAGVAEPRSRTRRLLNAVAGVASDLSLPDVLRRIASSARELVDAGYAASAVVDPDRQLIEFVHVRDGGGTRTSAAVGDAMPAPLSLCDFVERPQSFGIPPGQRMSLLLTLETSTWPGSAAAWSSPRTSRRPSMRWPPPQRDHRRGSATSMGRPHSHWQNAGLVRWRGRTSPRSSVRAATSDLVMGGIDGNHGGILWAQRFHAPRPLCDSRVPVGQFGPQHVGRPRRCTPRRPSNASR